MWRKCEELFNILTMECIQKENDRKSVETSMTNMIYFFDFYGFFYTIQTDYIIFFTNIPEWKIIRFHLRKK
jgi:hypothetical protein